MIQSAVVILGIKHCGKTTHGKMLADTFNCRFYDCDAEITILTGKTPRQIYIEQGEREFKRIEMIACSKLAGMLSVSPCVIATGGGICCNQRALDLLHKRGLFVFLDMEEAVPFKRIIEEITPDGNGGYIGLPAYIAKYNPRSIQEIKDLFHTFFIERTAKYKEIADRVISMTDAPVATNALRLVRATEDVLSHVDSTCHLY